MGLAFGPRRATYTDIAQEIKAKGVPLADDEVITFEMFDLVYRSLCAVLYNYVPMSGHPGGSISSGRFVAGVLFDAMDYDVSNPDRGDADICSYAAGHKALGLYAMWALRNEVARIGAPDLLPRDTKLQLRLEDLLGFRRNPITSSPLFRKFNSKPLDGHPTPATPFVRLATGASGVGVATSLGLAYGALDYWGANAPRVHIIEGEGGMTPGRVYEAMAAAGTASLSNAIMHIDWNQASIDSNHVCRDGETPGDYVQWNPMEVAYLHDWNVIYVPEGRSFQQIIAAQRKARAMDNGQPTAIVYRTTKGWKYGIEGRASHGAGHKLCSDGFYEAVQSLLDLTGDSFPSCEAGCQRCGGGANGDVMEQCLWDALLVVRKALESKEIDTPALARRLKDAKERLDCLTRKPRDKAPDIDAMYAAARKADGIPPELTLKSGSETTLRGELGKTLNYYNKASGGAIVAAAADLLGSTSVNVAAKGFPEGYYNSRTNPGSRLLSIGGICEDAMSGILSGMATYGRHIGAGSSYGAFIAALGHIASRLHAIGNQARQAIKTEPYKPYFLICAHAGVKTGEDGPTHADPQALQILQENFPNGTMITLTPWDPQELFPTVTAALNRRPCVIAPFVTRPNETVLDRQALGLAPATASATGVYRLRKANGKAAGTLVLQGSEVAYAFVTEALPLLAKQGIDLDVYYVASAELFDALSPEEKEKIFPQRLGQETMGITGFTLPTMYRWVCSERGRAMTLHPFQ
ncbi:MAG: Transketolase domain protein, partial [Candidatus Krumholzibacteriota bacterium]|nr:Transketolase domain protein [Candidatus Krumholzibacteriota bacterium]